MPPFSPSWLGMLIALPGFYALGFVFGYVWPNTTWLAPMVLRRWLVWLLLVSLLTVAIIGVFELSSGYTWGGRFLQFAGALVGAISGNWFRTSDESRDKLYFLVGAGIFLLLAAVEYDHRLFANLTKLGGAGISVEFLSQNSAERSNAAPTRALTPDQDYLKPAFPGAAGINLSVGLLNDVPRNIIADNDYARLFVGIPETEKVSTQRWFGMAQPTIQYMSYYCKDILQFVNDLKNLQDFHHSETSVLSIDPSLVSTLRDVY